MLPRQKEIEIPLLEALIRIGGQGRPKEIRPVIYEQLDLPLGE